MTELLQPLTARPPHEDARAILAILFRNRRLLPLAEGESEQCTEAELAVHHAKLLPAVAARRPLELILPAFPAKSSNRAKTLGDLPDLGEQLGLARLQELCDEIRAVYAPGASVTICSDGRVFSDLVGVSRRGGHALPRGAQGDDGAHRRAGPARVRSGRRVRCARLRLDARGAAGRARRVDRRAQAARARVGRGARALQRHPPLHLRGRARGRRGRREPQPAARALPSRSPIA